MIGYLTGTVLNTQQNRITVLAGDVGYEVYVTTAIAQESTAGSSIKLWTHLSISEQGWDLYGFESREARDLFRLLKKVPQVGSKTAQAVLNVFAVPMLIRLVSESDVQALTAVPGIGKKSAERMIVELRDRLADLDHDMSPVGGKAHVAGFDAIQALLGLGYGPQEAKRLIQKAIEQGLAANDLEGIVRFALSES